MQAAAHTHAPTQHTASVQHCGQWLCQGPREKLPPTFGPGGRSAAEFLRFCAFAATFFTAFFGFFFVAFFGAGAFFTAFFATIFTGFFFVATAFAMSLRL